MVLQNKIKYLFARAMPVLRKPCSTEAGMKMKTFTLQFFISNLSMRAKFLYLESIFFSCFSLCSVFQKIDTKQFALIETKIDQFFSVQSGQKTPTLAFIMQKLEPLLGSYFIKKYKII